MFTDYFTLWGLPNVSQVYHQRAINELLNQGKTEIPRGISTHVIVMTNDGSVMVRVSGSLGGFSAGKTSITFEEQMEPSSNQHPHYTVARGIHEELGITIPPDQCRLLGVGAEEKAAYVTLAYLAVINNGPYEIIKLLNNAKDYIETDLIGWLELEEVISLQNSSQGTRININTKDGKVKINANFHPTALWRIKLLDEYVRNTFTR